MNTRDKIIESFPNDVDRIFAARLIDDIEQAKKYFEPRFTQFLDPAQINKAKRIIEQFPGMGYKTVWDAEDCERNIILICPGTMTDEDIRLPVSVLGITYRSKFEKLSHRDILGALMSIGIKRDKIGDIIVYDDISYVYVSDDISYYIVMNLSRIKHAPVRVDYIEPDNVPKKQQKFREITSSIASMRLDSVLSCGFGESRSSIVQEINKGNVKVNWEEVTSASHMVKEGDTISLKGKGRIKIQEVGGMTKKGRIHVVIKKII